MGLPLTQPPLGLWALGHPWDSPEYGTSSLIKFDILNLGIASFQLFDSLEFKATSLGQSSYLDRLVTRTGISVVLWSNLLIRLPIT